MTQRHFDEILTCLGTGKWNLLFVIAFGFCGFMVPSFVLSGSFTTPQVKFSCNTPEGSQYEYLDKCHYRSNFVDTDGTKMVREHKCSNWTFHDEDFPTSLTQTFELVCDRSYLRPTYQTVYMFGNFLSAPINGFLSDRFGRRVLFTIGLITGTSCYMISSFLTNFTAHLVLRFIIGFSHPSIVQSGYILCMEVIEKKWRSFFGIMISLPWALGTIYWGFIGYYIDDWQWLIRVSTIPGLIFILIFTWSLDESPRWLIVAGKHERALTILKKAAKWNKAELPPDEEIEEIMKDIQMSSISTEPKQSEITNSTSKTIKSRFKKLIQIIWILYKTPELRRVILLIYVLFIVGSTVYYGLSLNAVNFKLNPYFYMMVGGVMEIPAYTVAIPIVSKFGRIAPTVISFLVCGFTIMALAFIPPDPEWLVITLAMIGKLCISSAYQIIYLISSEVFPTEVRLQALGTANFVSRIGSMLAPYVTDALGPMFPWIPSVLFGGLSLIAGVVAYFVPETLNKPLPETIFQLEEEAKKRRRRKKGESEDEIDLE